MANKCPICQKDYVSGDSVDIGIGFSQVSEDEPDCDCEYIEWLEEQLTDKELFEKGKFINTKQGIGIGKMISEGLAKGLTEGRNKND